MIIMDGIVALLLLAAIGYCLKLNKKIVELQTMRNELVQLIGSFTDVMQRAEHNIVVLRNSVKESQHLDSTITRAQILANELSSVIESGKTVEENLSGFLARAQQMTANIRQQTTAINNGRYKMDSARASDNTGDNAIKALSRGVATASPPQRAQPINGVENLAVEKITRNNIDALLKRIAAVSS
jgi:hypothetical protein